MSYKLLLVPEGQIEGLSRNPDPQTAYVNNGGLACVGPFEVIADVGEDRQLRMSRLVYDQIEVVDGAT